MKWLSSGLSNVSCRMTLGAVVLGLSAVSGGIAHAGVRAERTEGVQARASGPANSTPAASPSAMVPTGSRAGASGCNEALDALALCALPQNARQQSGSDEAARVAQAVAGPASGRIVSRETVDAAGEVGAAPFPTLAVLAFSLAIAGALLGAFHLRATASRAGREHPIRRAVVRSLGFPGHFEMTLLRKSSTAAIAKERLLQFRT